MFRDERIEGAGKIVGRSELAELLGYSLTTVDGWRRRGAPCIETDSGRRYCVPDVVQWLCDRDVAALKLDY